jgi:hypothetical protein
MKINFKCSEPIFASAWDIWDIVEWRINIIKLSRSWIRGYSISGNWSSGMWHSLDFF